MLILIHNHSDTHPLPIYDNLALTSHYCDIVIEHIVYHITFTSLVLILLAGYSTIISERGVGHGLLVSFMIDGDILL